MHTATAPGTLATPTATPELLIVDREEVTSRYVAALREKYRVTPVNTAEAALRHVERSAPAMVLLDLELPDGGADRVCRASKELTTPATVLVTTSEVECVPDAIEAGCDAVLLKPFAPNLLFARIGRLIRARSAELRYRSYRSRAKSEHLHDRSDLLLAGSNQHWPNTQCPCCEHQGVTSFEFTSYRRAWYACLACHKVWLAKRQE
jgi:DNA-binding response OmpR family regulator